MFTYPEFIVLPDAAGGWELYILLENTFKVYLWQSYTYNATFCSVFNYQYTIMRLSLNSSTVKDASLHSYIESGGGNAPT